MGLPHDWLAGAPPRLRPGYHLFPAAAGAWLLHTPQGQFIKLRVASELVAQCAELLSGRVAPALLLLDTADGAALSALLEQFARQGLIELPGDPPVPVQRQVVVLGQNAVAREVTRLLQQTTSLQICESHEMAPPERADALIACADWLPDRAWLSLDDWCRQRHIPWHMCYREGSRMYIGPLALPDGATYTDVRARRLAAATLPDELLAFWRYLDAGQGVPPAPPLDAGVVALVAGTLVADLLAWHTEQLTTETPRQRAIDTNSLAWTEHPVLPLPRQPAPL